LLPAQTIISPAPPTNYALAAIASATPALFGVSLKRLEREVVTIDANDVRAKIVPFAQHEMADRFLVGIDERHELTILTNVRKNLEDLGGSLIAAMPRMRRATKNRLRENLDASIETVLDDLRDKTMHELKEESRQESEDAVMFMAKPDLANFAEALVNITAVRRRASLETESVGGPIDVAVISRDDGFVWVKRKHYFERDLNPRFFARKYGTFGQRTGGRDDRE
jgi:predicted nuclease with TOPRIM domain